LIICPGLDYLNYSLFKLTDQRHDYGAEFLNLKWRSEMESPKTGWRDTITAFLNKTPADNKPLRSNGTSLLTTGSYEIARHRDGVIYVRSLRAGSKGSVVAKQIEALATAVHENNGEIVWSHTPVNNSLLHTVDEIYLEREKPAEDSSAETAAAEAAAAV
jgi:hypothetical protein